MNKSKNKKLAISALFTAIIAATAWISVPTPFGVNFTLQIFGVCLAGFMLGAKGGLAATAVYIALGSVGLPVFSSFTGGIGILLGTSGGFLWGFLPLAALCGITINASQKPLKHLIMVIAVLICHLIGVIQFCFVSGVTILPGFISVSLPFLVKDLIMIFLADFTANKIKKRITGG